MPNYRRGALNYRTQPVLTWSDNLSPPEAEPWSLTVTDVNTDNRSITMMSQIDESNQEYEPIINNSTISHLQHLEAHSNIVTPYFTEEQIRRFEELYNRLYDVEFFNKCERQFNLKPKVKKSHLPDWW